MDELIINLASLTQEPRRRPKVVKPKIDTRQVLWVYDPGAMTGFAKFLLDETAGELVGCGEFPTYSLLPHQIKFGHHVLYEKVVARFSGFNPIGLEVVGAIKVLCMNSIVYPHHQVHQKLTGIKKWGTFPLKDVLSEHARDAIHHGIIYLKEHNLEVTGLDKAASIKYP